MSLHQTNGESALPYAPVEPLAPTDHTVWVPCDKKALTFRLGNRAYVEEISGHPEVRFQQWRWRLCAIGGETGVAGGIERAMRAAEFALGLGEMPVRLPAVASGGKRKGGAA